MEDDQKKFKLLLKILKPLFIGVFSIISLFLLIFLILAPVMWLGELLGFGSEEKTTDVRDTIAAWQSENHISFISSEVIACTLNSDNGYDIDKCLGLIQEDGTIDSSDVDLSLKESYEAWNVEKIKEKQGKIPDQAYNEIHIPTLYVIDHYRKEQKGTITDPSDPNYGEAIVEWVYDHTGYDVYKESCSDNEPETKCRVIRDAFDTYPYTAPAYSKPSIKYGYTFKNIEDGTVEFNNFLEYHSSTALSLSTGIVNDIGEDEKRGKWIEMKYTNQGYTFYAEYSNLNVILVEIGDEVEWNKEIAYTTAFKLKVYDKGDQQQLYMNPNIFYEKSSGNSGNYDDILDGIISDLEGFEFMLPYDNYIVTQEYGGTNIDGNRHNGIDLQPTPFAIAAGHPIVAGFDGKVITNEYNRTSGNLIGIKDETTGVIVRYCHMIERSSLPVGTVVEQGQVIGFVGQTGLATGYHTHLTFIVNGIDVDPRTLVNF